MSATQKVQEHPVFVQAKSKADYYVRQLDKEVRISLLCTLAQPASHHLPAARLFANRNISGNRDRS